MLFDANESDSDVFDESDKEEVAEPTAEKMQQEKNITAQAESARAEDAAPAQQPANSGHWCIGAWAP